LRFYQQNVADLFSGWVRAIDLIRAFLIHGIYPIYRGYLVFSACGGVPTTTITNIGRDHYSTEQGWRFSWG
jgi:hypothetical protein